MLIDWTSEFDDWLAHVEEVGGPVLEWTTALLAELQDLVEPPSGETPALKRVRQARRHRLWRLAHPYDEKAAVRIIAWFPSAERAVVALVGFDKAELGDVWYESAAVRGEAMIDQWLREYGDPS